MYQFRLITPCRCIFIYEHASGLYKETQEGMKFIQQGLEKRTINSSKQLLLIPDVHI